MARKQTAPKALPEETIEIELEKAPVATRDAWHDSLDLAKGLDNLFHTIASSDNGLTLEGATALEVISRDWLAQMAIVNGYFNPNGGGD